MYTVAILYCMYIYKYKRKKKSNLWSIMAGYGAGCRAFILVQSTMYFCCGHKPIQLFMTGSIGTMRVRGIGSQSFSREGLAPAVIVIVK